jgi:hypothetical protein
MVCLRVSCSLDNEEALPAPLEAVVTWRKEGSLESFFLMSCQRGSVVLKERSMHGSVIMHCFER